MGKVLTQAQKTFTDLYDSYVLTLSSDIVAVPCDQYGAASENYSATIAYHANLGTLSVGINKCEMIGDAPDGVWCNTSTPGEITITVSKGTKLADDSEIGFTFTTANSNAFTFIRYVTFVNIKSGERVVTFQIKSTKGNIFKEGIDKLTLETVAFDGLTEIDPTQASFQWSYYDSAQSTPCDIEDATSHVLVVERDAPYSNSVIKCVMRYNDEDYDDVFSLSHHAANYDAVAKFFNGSNTIEATEPFVVTYVELYKDQQKEEVLQANNYFYDEGNYYNNAGLTLATDKIGSEYKIDGKNMYFIYRDEVATGASQATYCTITTDVSPSAIYGSASPGGRYQVDTECTLTAIANMGYAFVRWQKEDGTTFSPRNPVTFNVTGDLKLTAVFTATADGTEYTMTAGEERDIEVRSNEITWIKFTPAETGTYTFTSLGEIDVVGYLYSANKEYIAQDDESGADDGAFLITATLMQDITYYWGVQFHNTSHSGEARVKLSYENVSATTYTVSAYVEERASGKIVVQLEDGWYTQGTDLNVVVDSNEYITLTAVPAADYTFLQWSDGETNPVRSVIVTSNLVYRAIFEYTPPTPDTVYYAVTATSNNTSWGTVTGGGPYPEGATATLTATSMPNYEFVQWDDGDTNSVKTFQVSKDIKYIATFQPFNGYSVDIIPYNTVSEYDDFKITKDASGQQPWGKHQFKAGEVFYCYLEAGAGRIITQIDVEEDDVRTHSWTGNSLIANGANSSCTIFSKRYDVTSDMYEHKIVFYVKFDDEVPTTPDYELITEGVNKSVATQQIFEPVYLKFIPQHTGTYVFKSLNQQSLDPQGEICDQDMYPLDSSLGNTGFSLSYYFEQGETYYLGVSTELGVGTVIVNVSYVENGGGGDDDLDDDILTEGSWIPEDTAVSVQIPSRNVKTYFAFKPTHSGSYTFETLSDEGDPDGYICNSDHNVIPGCSNTDGNVGFSITYDDFKKDTVYYLAVVLYDAAGVAKIRISYNGTGSVPDEPTSYKLTLVADPPEGGTVTGEGSYVLGEFASVTATPNDGYQFVGWYENGELHTSVQNPRVGLDRDRTLTAKFEAVYYTVKTVVSPPNAGTVTGAGTYLKGTQVKCVATGLGEYTIKGWIVKYDDTGEEIRDNENIAYPQLGLIVSHNTTVTALFKSPSGGDSGGDSYAEDTLVGNTLYIGTNQTKIQDDIYYKHTWSNSIVNVVIPSGITSIGAQAFRECSNLKTITIPTTVTYVNAYAFYGCSALSDVYYEGSQSAWNAININSLGDANNNLVNANIHCNYTSTYAAAPMMMRSAAPMTLSLEDDGIATYSNEEDSTVRCAKYKAVLCQYKSATNKWERVSDNSTYVYKNDMYDDVTSNVVVIAKEDIAYRQDVSFTVYNKILGEDSKPILDNDLIVARTNTTVFDLNDPIVSNIEPKNPKEGQMWLDQISWELKIFKNGKWERFEQQGGQRVFTSIDQVKKGYEKGDLWILEATGLCGSFTKGTMLQAVTTKTAEELNGYVPPSDWVDAMDWAAKLKQDVEPILQNMSFNTKTGLRIGQTGSNACVNIDSGEVGIYDENATRTVWINKQTARMTNLQVEGDATFSLGKLMLGSTFAIQIETDGSISLVTTS